MFYQTPNLDSTILIAFALIASIIFVFVVVATIILLRSENQKKTTSPLKDEPETIPPVEIVASTIANERQSIDVLPTSLAESAAPSVLEETQIIDLPATPPVEISAAPVQEERPKSEFHLSPRVIQSLWGIFLTTALMFAVTLAITNFIFSYVTNILATLLLLASLPFGISVAGTVGVRLTRLEWRLIFVPVLLFLTVSALFMPIPSYGNNSFFLLLAALGSVFVPLMNREGKEVNLSLQSINWIACFIIASFLAFWGYSRLRVILGPPLSIPVDYYWFAILMAFISPACMAVAWLRLTGTKWLPALLMIPSLPVGVLIILVLTSESG
jgi:hypothetical protein